MNKASRIAAAINSQANPFQLKACLFHCTPVSERRRRTNWDPTSSYTGQPKKFNQYIRRLRKKQMWQDVNEFAGDIFQSWGPKRDMDDECTAGEENSWFRLNFSRQKQNCGSDRYKKGKSRNRAPQGFRHFDFCEDNNDGASFDNVFRSMFGGNRTFYWSFTRDDEPHFWSSSNYSSNYKTTSDWNHFDEEYEEYTSSTEYVRPVDGLRSERLALGLTPSGPLNIEDVKTAYRACALKWHPDRHQGSSKVDAEEKFKVCSAAYQSLCDKLALH